MSSGYLIFNVHEHMDISKELLDFFLIRQLTFEEIYVAPDDCMRMH